VNLGGFRLFAVFIAQGGRESGLRIFQTFYCIFYCISLDHAQKKLILERVVLLPV